MTRARDLADSADKDISGTVTLDDIVLSNDMSVADNGKVIFGAGSDLQIYHDGSNSFISDQGTGHIKILANDFRVVNAANTEQMITANQDGAVTLYNDSVAKLATNSSGVDVEGNLVAKGYLASEASNSTNKWLAYTYTDNTFRINYNGAGADELTIDSSGNVGIGMTPTYKLDISGEALRIKNTSGTGYIIDQNANSSVSHILYENSFMRFGTNSAERMRIDSSGNVGIGNNSPNYTLSVEKDVDTWVSRIYNTGSDANASGLLVRTDATAAHNAIALGVYADSGYKMVVKSTGNVGIGTSSPVSNSNYNALTISDSTGGQIYFKSTGGSVTGYAGADSAAGGSAYLATLTNHPLIFRTNNTERMRITSSGYIEATGASQVRLTLGSEGTAGTNNANWIRGNGTSLGFNSASGGYQWEISGTERMRLDSSGNLLIGTTSTSAIDTPGFRFIQGAAGYSEFSRTADDGTANIYLSRGNNGRVLAFYRVDGGNTQVGTITVTSSATSYNTSSDYRLKENVDYTWDATTRIKQLKPARFNFIGDADTIVDGFLAHEVSSIVPEAITGTKDAVKADGKPEYQGIDQSKLVPLLVKTIQELEARITALEG